MPERYFSAPIQPESTGATGKGEDPEGLKKSKKSKKRPDLLLDSSSVIPGQRAPAAEKISKLDGLLGELVIRRDDKEAQAPAKESDHTSDGTLQESGIYTTEAESDTPPQTGEEIWSQKQPANSRYVGEALELTEEATIILRDGAVAESPEPAKPASAATGPAEYVPRHAAAGAAEQAESLPAAGNGGQMPPGKPPVPPSRQSEQPSVPGPGRRSAGYAPSIEPAQQYRDYEAPAVARQYAETPPAATKKEVEEVMHRVKRQGRYQNVLAEAVLDGTIEHRIHKRRERKTEKRQKALDKKRSAADARYEFGQKENERMQAETSLRLSSAESRYQTTTTKLEKRTQQAEQAATAAAAAAAQAEVQAQDRLEIPAEHDVKVSAWLATETDRKTGRVVDNPSFQYGQEYHRERAQEIKAVQQRDVATGEIAVAGTAASQRSGVRSDMAAAASIPDASVQRAQPTAPQASPSPQPSRSTQPSSSQSDSSPLWPWVLALIVVGISLIFALG